VKKSFFFFKKKKKICNQSIFQININKGMLGQKKFKKKKNAFFLVANLATKTIEKSSFILILLFIYLHINY
jgi:hypothetical protein